MPYRVAIVRFTFLAFTIVFAVVVALYVECRLGGGTQFDCAQSFKGFRDFIQRLMPWGA